MPGTKFRESAGQRFFGARYGVAQIVTDLFEMHVEPLGNRDSLINDFLVFPLRVHGNDKFPLDRRRLDLVRPQAAIEDQRKKDLVRRSVDFLK